VAKPRRKRVSAPIPDDLPPVYAPKNGRIPASVRDEAVQDDVLRKMVACAKKAGSVSAVNHVCDDAQTDIYGAVASNVFTWISNSATGASGIYTGNALIDTNVTGSISFRGSGWVDVIDTGTAGQIYSTGSSAGLINITGGLINTRPATFQAVDNETVLVSAPIVINAPTTITNTCFTVDTGTANAITITGADMYGDGWNHQMVQLVNYARRYQEACDADWGGWHKRACRRCDDLGEAWQAMEAFSEKARAWKQWNAILATTKETRKQREARDAHNAEQARIAADRRAREQAEYEMRRARAEMLLQSVLNPRQREEYQAHGMFHLYTKSGKKYRIKKGGQHGNVYLLNEKDEEVTSYCIQPQGGLPDADAHVAQKLLLETDEASFLRIANASQLRR